jgi:dTDP-4-dehydrorhamnose reductase
MLFVTGGRGFLGRRVVALAATAGWEVVAPTSADLDVRDGASVAAAIAASHPLAVVHLAYRAAEADTIVDGSTNVAQASRSIGARLVHLSTDVVFAGRDEPYVEDDRPDPVFAYGRAKAEAESAVAAADPGAAIVRTSLLYSADRNDLATCQTDVTEPGFTFFVDEHRSPACVDDVAAAVVALAGPLVDVHGPLHVAGPEAWSRDRFAAHVVRWLDLDAAALRTARRADLGLVRPGRVVLDVSLAEGHGLRCRPVSEVLRPRSS